MMLNTILYARATTREFGWGKYDGEVNSQQFIKLHIFHPCSSRSGTSEVSMVDRYKVSLNHSGKHQIITESITNDFVRMRRDGIPFRSDVIIAEFSSLSRSQMQVKPPATGAEPALILGSAEGKKNQTAICGHSPQYNRPSTLMTRIPIVLRVFIYNFEDRTLNPDKLFGS